MTIKQIENYHSQITEQTMENVARSTYKIRIGQNTTNLWSTETTLPFGFPKESSNNGEIRQRRTRSRASLFVFSELAKRKITPVIRPRCE